MRKVPRVHYIDAASVQVGDLIRATVKNRDVEISTVGRIARIEYAGNVRYLYSAEGFIIHRGNTGQRGRVTLLEPGPGAQPEPLFGADMLAQTRERTA